MRALLKRLILWALRDGVVRTDQALTPAETAELDALSRTL